MHNFLMPSACKLSQLMNLLSKIKL